jgi:membrane fusion protein, multidrug efflux system
VPQIALLAGSILLSACSPKDSAALKPPEMPPVPVMVAKAVQKTVPLQLHEIGTVQPYSTVSVKSRVEGELTEVHFREGDEVKKGQLLFTIDPRPFEAALLEAKANLDKDQAQAQKARTDEQRYAYMLRRGVGSREQYDQARATAQSLKATVEADKAAVETAKLNLQYTEIRSPIDGWTGNLIIHAGNLIKADSDTAMVVINQIEPIYVQFALPEGRLAEVRKYMGASQLEVHATIPGQPGPGEHGVLNFIDNSVDNTTGTILLKGLFANSDKRLWPGEFANVTLTLTEHPNAILVPSQAIQRGQKGSYVFVVNHNLSVEVRPVVAGDSLDNETVIKSGLKDGETVVTDGQLRLSPGARVKIRAGLDGSAGAVS